MSTPNQHQNVQQPPPQQQPSLGQAQQQIPVHKPATIQVKVAPTLQQQPPLYKPASQAVYTQIAQTTNLNPSSPTIVNTTPQQQNISSPINNTNTNRTPININPSSPINNTIVGNIAPATPNLMVGGTNISTPPINNNNGAPGATGQPSLGSIDSSIDLVLRKNNLVNPNTPTTTSTTNINSPPNTSSPIISTTTTPPMSNMNNTPLASLSGAPVNNISVHLPQSSSTSSMMMSNKSMAGTGTSVLISGTNPLLYNANNSSNINTYGASLYGSGIGVGGNTITTTSNLPIGGSIVNKPKKEKEKERREREIRDKELREQFEKEQRDREFNKDIEPEVLGKRKLIELLSQISPNEKMDEDVEEILSVFADDFVESTVAFACTLAKHRNSSTLEVKDLQCHLEKNWNIRVPGFGNVEQYKTFKKSHFPENHKQRVAAMKKSIAITQALTRKQQVREFKEQQKELKERKQQEELKQQLQQSKKQKQSNNQSPLTNFK